MKKLVSLLLAAMLLLALAACGGASPAPLAPAQDSPVQEQPSRSGPVGVWTLSEPGSPEYAPGQISLLLDEDGFGYQAITDFAGDYAYQDYQELRWSEGAIVIDGVGGVYLLQGDSLTFTWNGVTDVYVRSADAPAPLTPPVGSYTSHTVYEEGEAYPDDTFSFTLADDGSGSYTGHGETLSLTWNRYFLTLDDDQSFYYVYDGDQIIVYDGEYQIVLRAD